MAAFLKLGDIKGEFASKANAYVDEDVDGYMKLGDIKGEIVYGDGDEIIYGGGGHNYLKAVTFGEDGRGRFTTGGGGDSLNSCRDARHSPKNNEGLVIPTDGDDIVIDGLDRMANAYVDGAIGGFQADALTKGGQVVGLDVGLVNAAAEVWTTGPVTSIADALTNAGQQGFTWEAASDIWTNGGASTFTPVANRNGTATFEVEVDSLLLQQANDTIAGGQLNPNQMQPAEFFSHAIEWFAPGSAVESLVPNSD